MDPIPQKGPLEDPGPLKGTQLGTVVVANRTTERQLPCCKSVRGEGFFWALPKTPDLRNALSLSSLLTPRKEGPSILEGILEVGTRTLPICGHFLYNLSLRGVALNCKRQFVFVKKYFHILFLVV